MSDQPSSDISRRHPFSDLESWKPLRGVMDEFFSGWPSDLPSRGHSLPSVDITETDQDYRVRAELPGVSRDDVTVELQDGVLCVRGEKKSSRDEKTERGRRLECSYGTFSRSFTLPKDADADQIAAEFRDGVLDVKIAKLPESKPTQIAVKG